MQVWQSYPNLSLDMQVCTSYPNISWVIRLNLRNLCRDTPGYPDLPRGFFQMQAQPAFIFQCCSDDNGRPPAGGAVTTVTDATVTAAPRSRLRRWLAVAGASQGQSPDIRGSFRATVMQLLSTMMICPVRRDPKLVRVRHFSFQV